MGSYDKMFYGVIILGNVGNHYPLVKLVNVPSSVLYLQMP